MEWISVEDEEPKKDVRVLVNRTSEYKRIAIATLSFREWGGEPYWRHDCGGPVYPFPTHWMPLPEPPKED